MAKQKTLTERFLAAARGGQVNVLRTLLKQSPEINACDDEAKLNLPYGDKFNLVSSDWKNVKAPAGLEGKAGNTALMWACHRWGGEKMAQALLDAGADPKITNLVGETALHYASAKIFSAIVAKGADVNAQNLWGATPLMYALEQGGIDSAIALLDLGADPSLKTKQGIDTIMIAQEKMKDSLSMGNQAGRQGAADYAALIVRMEKGITVPGNKGPRKSL